MVTQIKLGSEILTSQSVLVTAIRNGGFPDTDQSQTQKGGYTGLTLSSQSFLSYKFVIEWNVVGTSFSDLATARENFVSKLGSIISAGGKNLQITKSNGVTVQVDVKGVNIRTDVSTQDPLNARIYTEMDAEYPFLRDLNGISQDVNIFSGGGMPIPMPIPMPMNLGGTGEVTLVNGGNYNAYPIFTFYGPLDNPVIANVTTGEQLQLNLSLATASDRVEVDVFLRSAKFTPSMANARQYITGDFWTLAVGNNVIHLAQATYNIYGKCNISYADTYLGI